MIKHGSPPVTLADSPAVFPAAPCPQARRVAGPGAAGSRDQVTAQGGVVEVKLQHPRRVSLYQRVRTFCSLNQCFYVRNLPKPENMIWQTLARGQVFSSEMPLDTRKNFNEINLLHPLSCHILAVTAITLLHSIRYRGQKTV